jgi:hypothetical protein
MVMEEIFKWENATVTCIYLLYTPNLFESNLDKLLQHVSQSTKQFLKRHISGTHWAEVCGSNNDAISRFKKPKYNFNFENAVNMYHDGERDCNYL